ncbi:MAG TPA: amino acid adenylation domain-containing protein [Pseudonocardiaceae bacterium]|nr:amino acid adenylation domain-containing protein [Pseudonocardiaceae bacterium]
MTLHQLATDSAARQPDALAVHGPDGELSYRELDRLAGTYAAGLAARGVRPGDRILIWSRKSTQVVALMQGCLRIGAVYVPVSSANPPHRLVRIHDSATPVLVVADEDGAARVDPDDWSDHPLTTLTALREEGVEAAIPVSHRAELDEPAYILYTSGSTGDPKGVCLSHRNALAFVRWAAAELQLTTTDRLSNHAPFNFDLSVFDLFAAFLAGASVHLVPEEMAYAPAQLVSFLIDRRISVWYSVPSALSLMMREGRLIGGDPPAGLRACVFAGEPFAIHQVVALRKAWPGVRLLNWYGPTETNVCTSYEVTEADVHRQRPLPIGRAVCGDTIELVSARGEAREGEIVVSGPTVMLGYWGREPQAGPYRTGDLARRDERGDLEYLGRRDHMVKVRGHRIELGEVESAAAGHEAVADCVALVVGNGLEARLHAVVVPRGERGPSLLALKRLCAERLPTYMIVDAVHTVTELPRTANGKIDRTGLTDRIETGQLG